LPDGERLSWQCSASFKGADRIRIERFCADMSPAEFIRTIVIDKLNALEAGL